MSINPPCLGLLSLEREQNSPLRVELVLRRLTPPKVDKEVIN
jgi:hypothetical protein